ncbi:MAG: endonuclease V, partial [Anaerolineae bacterium]|nr:endonuclease V [Anaerolineae bacterium]
MHLNQLHNWNLTPGEAIVLQKQLAGQLIDDRPLDLGAIRFIAGVDVSVKNNVSQAAVVVMSFPDLQIVETVTAQQPTPFPYIPGLLSFREGPVLVDAFERLKREPDVFIFDGMGRAHPRRIGI